MRVIALAVVLVALMPPVAQSQQNHPSDDHGVWVSVLGAVATPGRYELKSCETILDALAAAGGFTQYASRSNIVLLRPKGATVKRIPFNPFWWEEWGFQREDYCLRQGDTILVQ